MRSDLEPDGALVYDNLERARSAADDDRYLAVEGRVGQMLAQQFLRGGANVRRSRRSRVLWRVTARSRTSVNGCRAESRGELEGFDPLIRGRLNGPP